LPERKMRFVVLAYNVADGSLAWQKTVRTAQPHDATHVTGSWASNSAVTDGERLYVSFGSHGIYALDLEARELGTGAEERSGSLEALAAQLESKRHKLASMPSIWPARGWLTSRFGYRTSPFTGRRQRHAGIDIATKIQTPILAPAKARVSFVGTKGPLGNTVVLDHGYGVRTFYGHTHEIHVKIGDEVERGQEIASVGNSGRSTGPHLHYTVEVGGESVNPMNYIFD